MASGNRDHALTMRAAGQSFGAIGQALGVSRQRAWQLCQADAPTPVAHLLSPRIGREDLETWRGKVGLTVAAAERALGLSAGSWRYMLRAGARSAVVVCMGLVEETVAHDRADGLRAAANGLSALDCPWSAGTWRGAAWRAGWNDEMQRRGRL